MENFEVKEQGNNANTLLSAVKLAYRQYKSDLDYVKNKSNIWEGKPYRWGFKALTFRPDVKQLKSNDLASWHAAPLAVIHCWQQ